MERLNIPNSLKKIVIEMYGKDFDSLSFDDDNIIKKINLAYEDALLFSPKIKTFKLVVYFILKDYNPTLKVKEYEILKYLRELLDDEELKNRLRTGSPKSEFFGVLKDIYPYYNELSYHINNKNNYNAILTYQKIVDILDKETINLHQDREEVCHNRYNYPNDNYAAYKRRFAKKKYKEITYFNPEMLIARDSYSITCSYLMILFHEIMFNFYKLKGYYYSPINEDLSFYAIGSIKIIEYSYSDNLSFSIDKYSWKSFEFWALLHQGRSVKVDDSAIRSLMPKEKKLLVVPKGYKEVAIIKYLMHELGENTVTPELLKLMRIFNLDEDYLVGINNLDTKDYRTFYISLSKEDDLKMKDASEYVTLNSILARNYEDREAYYKKLYYTYKAKHPEKELDEEEEIRKNPKAWIK